MRETSPRDHSVTWYGQDGSPKRSFTAVNGLMPAWSVGVEIRTIFLLAAFSAPTIATSGPFMKRNPGDTECEFGFMALEWLLQGVAVIARGHPDKTLTTRYGASPPNLSKQCQPWLL
ncbi:uncharacterized protein RCC_06957 [Ramularia collo-cygni]|uniref:Uncharacterized protein n=1 Tax=Ramularia collo-cygni TaxID=112498 RepID=A0A2D3VBM6_9PEZI|nr:uncharacterized protein RCC_06957 [Ramularia collo-cygni]CZT21096.1 uncharacterized protein RCC_06957 [Ramularia collo-cygni]